MSKVANYGLIILTGIKLLGAMLHNFNNLLTLP